MTSIPKRDVDNRFYRIVDMGTGTGATATLKGVDLNASDAPAEWEMDWPQYSHRGMGCGLEDRGIHDRYDAMRYGWDEAMEQVACVLANQTLYAVPPVNALTDERISEMIENADPISCIDGEYRFEGRELMALIRSILQAQAEGETPRGQS